MPLETRWEGGARICPRTSLEKRATEGLTWVDMGSSSEEMERLEGSREGLEEEAVARPESLAVPPPLPPKRPVPASSTGRMTPAAPVAFRPAMSLPAVPAAPRETAAPDERDAELKTLRLSEAALREELAEARRQGTEALARVAAAGAKAEELGAELRAEAEERKDLSRALAEVEAELGRVQGQVAEAGASRELVLERDQLKEDAAAMKRKLMAAELALETAASYKMKLAKLEAQLAQLLGAK